MVTIKIQSIENDNTFRGAERNFETTTGYGQDHVSAIGAAFRDEYGANAVIGAFGILRDVTGSPITSPVKTLFGTCSVEGVAEPVAFIARIETGAIA